MGSTNVGAAECLTNLLHRTFDPLPTFAFAEAFIASNAAELRSFRTSLTSPLDRHRTLLLAHWRWRSRRILAVCDEVPLETTRSLIETRLPGKANSPRPTRPWLVMLAQYS